MNVRITSDGTFVGSQVFVNGEEVTATWFVSSVGMQIGSIDEMPTITLELQPDHIEYEGESRIICHYIDPVTGERFTRDAALPTKADG